MKELYLVMDETDAPYNENEVTFSRDDDASLVRFALNHGMEFKEDSPLGLLAKEVKHTS